MENNDENMVISFLIEYAKLFDKKIVYNGEGETLKKPYEKLEEIISSLISNRLKEKFEGEFTCEDWMMICKFSSYNELIDSQKYLIDNFSYSKPDFTVKNNVPYSLKFRIFEGVEAPPKIKPQKKKKEESMYSIYNRLGGMRESDASEESYDSLFSEKEGKNK